MLSRKTYVEEGNKQKQQNPHLPERELTAVRTTGFIIILTCQWGVLGVIYCSPAGSGLCPDKPPSEVSSEALQQLFAKRLQQHYVKTVSRLGWIKTSPTEQSLFTWSKYRNLCLQVRQAFGNSRWGVVALTCCTQLKGEQPREAQWCSHPYIQDQEHDKDGETAICRGQVWATRNSPNPGLILAKSNQTFYPKSPTGV